MKEQEKRSATFISQCCRTHTQVKTFSHYRNITKAIKPVFFKASFVKTPSWRPHKLNETCRTFTTIIMWQIYIRPCVTWRRGYVLGNASLGDSGIMWTSQNVIFTFAPCINSIKNTSIIPTDAHYYKNHRMLKQFKNYNTCSDMFRFTQEPSSGSSPVLC